MSQRHAGWIALANMYDDGGLSGGSMERPALKRLLEDIKTGKVQTVVVYKVDRLTRSLADFAKIVDVLDTHNARRNASDLVMVVPEPEKVSRQMSRRRVQSRIASATSATGLTVGCDLSSSIRPAPNVFTPR